jgi:hypothetical protein
MRRVFLLPLLGAIAVSQDIPLEPLTRLKLHNVKAEAVRYKGRKAVRIDEVAAPGLTDVNTLAVVTGTDFHDGIIEVDLTGDTPPEKTDPTFRGFVGIAFRLATDGSRYECFYLRPKNGRSDDQLQRNHSAQYISAPEFPWQRLRSETPAKYETYVDLVPGEWTKMKIDVRGDKARLYVNVAEQPVLIVNDLKHGDSKGAIALWVGPGTVAHFTSLRVAP